jgi:hypothetical protein
VQALNQKASDWLAAHTDSQAIWCANSLVVQRRYVEDLIDRLRAGGFQVEIV